MENEEIELSSQYNAPNMLSKRFVVISIIVFVFLGMAADLIYVNYSLLNAHPSPAQIATTLPSYTLNEISPTATPVPNFVINPTGTSPSPTFTPVPTMTTTPSPTPAFPTPTVTPIVNVKDYFIPLGTGENQSSDWENVPGDQVTIDFGQYPHIKKILFEASVTIPSASEWVSVRLFNETDMHPVWNSTVTSNGNTSSAFLTSPPMTYDTGMKTYQVQMETQLQSPVNLVQSRIHIFLQ